MERNRVSGFPGGFPPPFQASLLCTARNSANDLCTPNIQPTFRSETAYRGPLDLKYSIPEPRISLDSKGAYFENDLNLRKGERKAQVEFRFWKNVTYYYYYCIGFVLDLLGFDSIFRNFVQRQLQYRMSYIMVQIVKIKE